MVDVEPVVRVLDHRHALALLTQRGDDLFDQRGLARAGKPGKADDFHVMRPWKLYF